MCNRLADTTLLRLGPSPVVGYSAWVAVVSLISLVTGCSTIPQGADCRDAGLALVRTESAAAESAPVIRLVGIDPVDSTGSYDEPAGDVGNISEFGTDVGPLEKGPHNRASLGVPGDAGFLNFRDDWDQCALMLRDDVRGVVNWNNSAILGGSLAASILIRQDLDGQVRENTARHPGRWGDGTVALGRLGEAQYQIPAILLVYGYSLHNQDESLHDMSTSLISAYTLTGLSTLAIKGIANTDRPSTDWNGGQFGFPSFHAASWFSMAAVLDEYYGPEVGMPSYALAGLVGWSRIDERDHDLSDVVFGAALGYVIGKSVARRHRDGDSRVHLLPYVHPTDGSSGLALDVVF